MHTREHQIKPEYRQGILKVLHYINQNLMNDVSLEILAEIANYSPFHFQRIFSEAIMETPKQYVMRLRLERAAHYLKLFLNLPVVEIGMGCGFSSPSIFSRAFKNYFGTTPESFRNMSSNEISELSKKNRSGNKPFVLKEPDLWSGIINPQEERVNIMINPPPVVKSFSSRKFACIQTMLGHPESIRFAFKSLMKWAIPNEIVTADVKYVGIWLDVPFFTSPEKCRYITGIEIKNEIKAKDGIDVITMNEGKYASFTMRGSLDKTINHIVAVNHVYLDEMGYDVAEIIGYEIFDECPAYKPYEMINKNILLPVKPRKI